MMDYMKLLKYREISVKIFQKQGRGVNKNILVVGLSTHLVLKGKSAILILDCAIPSVLVDVFQEL